MEVPVFNGDILKSGKNIIGHQVNNQGKMGAGLALQIRQKYPIVYNRYIKFCQENNYDWYKLRGKIHVVTMLSAGSSIRIANIFSQNGVSRKKRTTDYKSLEIGLKRLRSFAQDLKLSVALPYGIGSGLGGGDWNTVSEIIDSVFHRFDGDISLWMI